jgi:hypothetical protein
MADRSAEAFAASRGPIPSLFRRRRSTGWRTGLQAAAREEAARALSGLASALNYEKLRSDGWSLREGWDRCAPAMGGLPVVREYHLRNAVNRKIYVSEPKALTARAIHALEALALSGAWEVTVAAAALSLPGEALKVSIWPRR